MSIYGKLIITGFVFLVLMWAISYPETKYTKRLTKKYNGNYTTVLLLHFGIGLIPIVIISLVYVWLEL